MGSIAIQQKTENQTFGVKDIFAYRRMRMATLVVSGMQLLNCKQGSSDRESCPRCGIFGPLPSFEIVSALVRSEILLVPINSGPWPMGP